MLSETTNCCSALKQPLMRGDWKWVCAKLFLTPLKPPNPDLQYNYTGCIAMCMVFQYLQHVYSTISFYFHWRAISDNQGQKCWQIWAKQTLSMGVLLKFQKNVFFVHILISPLPLFNVEICFVDTVAWLQHWKGIGGRYVNIGDWKTHVFNETGLFSQCLNCFCPWL